MCHNNSETHLNAAYRARRLHLLRARGLATYLALLECAPDSGTFKVTLEELAGRTGLHRNTVGLGAVEVVTHGLAERKVTEDGGHFKLRWFKV